MFSIPPLICAIYFLSIGILVFFQNKNKPLAKVFFALCFTTFIWQFTWALLFQTKDYKTGLLLVKLGYFFILFLPTTLYHFLTILSERKDELKKVYFSYALSLLLAVTLIFSNKFIDGMYSYFWGYYPKAGALHPVHVLQTIIVVSRGLYITYKKEKKSTALEKSQLHYCLIALFVYLFAAIDYLCNYGFEFYPVGAAFIVISLAIITYAILKRKLLGINLVISLAIKRILAYCGFAAIFIIINFILTQAFLPKNNFYLIFSSIFLIFCCETYSFISKKIQILSDKILIRELVEYKKMAQVLNKYLDTANSHKEIYNFLQEFFTQTLGLKIVSFYLKDQVDDNEKTNNYKIFNDDSGNKDKLIELDNDLIKTIIKNNSFLEKIQLPESIHQSRNMILLPFISNQKIIAFILITLDKKTFNYKHYEIFNLLINQVGLVIDRLDAYLKISLQKEQFLIRQRTLLKSLSGSLSHELRTPLATVRGFARLVKMSLESVLKNSTDKNNITIPLSDVKESLEYLNICDNVIAQGNMMIDLTLEKIHDKPIDKNKFSNTSILKTINQALKQYAFQDVDEKEKIIIDIDKESDFIYLGIKEMMLSVLFNLIKNSLYYSVRKKEFKIIIFTSKKGNWNYLHFKDNGPGINESMISTIFNNFMTHDKIDGTGLGLPFCKRIMEDFGGTIKCISKPGFGAEFIMEFPVV